jgi:hypothetical protein
MAPVGSSVTDTAADSRGCCFGVYTELRNRLETNNPRCPMGKKGPDEKTLRSNASCLVRSHRRATRTRRKSEGRSSSQRPQAANAPSAPAGSPLDAVDGLSGQAMMAFSCPMAPLGPPIHLREPICPREPKGGAGRRALPWSTTCWPTDHPEHLRPPGRHLPDGTRRGCRGRQAVNYIGASASARIAKITTLRQRA